MMFAVLMWFFIGIAVLMLLVWMVSVLDDDDDFTWPRNDDGDYVITAAICLWGTLIISCWPVALIAGFGWFITKADQIVLFKIKKDKKENYEQQNPGYSRNRSERD